MMKYNDYAIERLENRLLELFMKKSTPQKYAAVMLEAAEVIQQFKKKAIQQPNAPLTLEELREMDDDWVWIKLLVPLYRMDSGYYIKHERFSSKDSLCCGYPDIVVRNLLYASYGCDWLAYRRRPEEAAP